MRAPQNQKAAPTIRFMTIIGVGLWGSTLLFLYLVSMNPTISLELVNPEAFFEKSPQARTMLINAFGAAAIAIFVPKFLSKKALSKAVEQTGGEVEASTVVKVAGLELTVALTALFQPYIVRLALAEAVALFGFLAALNTSEISVMLPFYAISWFIFARNIATNGRVERWVRQGSM